LEDETPPAEESTETTASTAEASTDAADSTETETAAAANAETEASADVDAADIDLGETVVEVMAELDDGNGVEHAVLISELIDRYGVDETAIEEAIADALMGGRCYETGDDTLKAI